MKKEGGDPQVEIMIPLVATAPELEQMRAELEPVAQRGPRATRASSSGTWSWAR